MPRIRGEAPPEVRFDDTLDPDFDADEARPRGNRDGRRDLGDGAFWNRCRPLDAEEGE